MRHYEDNYHRISASITRCKCKVNAYSNTIQKKMQPDTNPIIHTQTVFNNYPYLRRRLSLSESICEFAKTPVHLTSLYKTPDFNLWPSIIQSPNGSTPSEELIAH
ncbi:hypothetical protein CEXT_702411 [Caerostris extrusa]|uniref:Uncharacterized protein n=1 Tax=Caerostris extrusa TaxID=172846 RepID=A0AAV4N120_CAEEX|nr:hypothetical protein CEXT_702411 [Caerostris extrusa]